MLTCTGDPFASGLKATLRYESDAIVVIDDGRIVEAGPARTVRKRLPDGMPVEQLSRATLIVPGFVDCHVHYVTCHPRSSTRS